MLRYILSVAAFLALAACASYQSRVAVVRPVRSPLPGSKTVVFLDTGDPKHVLPLGAARARLALQLEAAGFEVKRFAQDGVPYGLEARGSGERCDDGFLFKWIEIDVVDMRANRVVYSVSGAGATEGCAVSMDMKTKVPSYGTLFAELASSIAKAWGGPAKPPVTPLTKPPANEPAKEPAMLRDDVTL